MLKAYKLFASVETISNYQRPELANEHAGRLWIPDDDVLEMYKKGGFTRENVLWWLEHRYGYGSEDEPPVLDFHAHFGYIDIPWAKEESRLVWEAEAKRRPIHVTREAIIAFDKDRDDY